MKEINSKNNQFIKDLVKEAKNRFLLFLDTPNLVKEAISHNLGVKYILQSKNKTFNFIESISADKVIFVSDEILKQFSFVENNAGIVGIFEFPKKQFENPVANYLVLDCVQDAGNVGTLLRSAKGANFNTVYLIDSASVTNPKVVRSSAGAVFDLNIFELTKEEFLKSFKKDNLYVATMDGSNIFELQIAVPVGVALGNEGKGISDEILMLAGNKKLSVPMENSLESLNVAVSGSIIMYNINFGGQYVRTFKME